MKHLKKLLALMLVLALVAALFVGCTKNEKTESTAAENPATEAPKTDAPATDAPATDAPKTEAPGTDEPGTEAPPVTDEPTEPATEAPTEPEGPIPGSALVYVTSTFDQKFSPFFYTTAYDAEVVDLVHGYLLAADRGGAILEGAISDEGVDVDYDGTTYNYRARGDVEVVQNDDGTVDYNLTMRDDIKFSDGVPATMDDVIFGIYVMCDPTYDGSSTIYALPIEGMDAYRNGMDTLFNLMLAAGRDNTDFTNWTEEEQTTFWTKMDAAGEAFAQAIVDYCVAAYADDYAEAYIGATADEVRADEGLQVKLGMALWGYGDAWAEGATAADYWTAIVAAYEGDIMAASDKEKADDSSTIPALFEGYDDYTKGISTGEGAPNISGIKKVDDYHMTIHMTKFDATAIYNMSFIIAPMHYYGEESLYDYDNNKFGFNKGDLSHVKSVTATPVGCGAFTFDGYANGTVTFTANPNFYKGCPKLEHVYFQEGVDSDYVPGIEAGNFDIAAPSINDDTLNAIKDSNGGDIVGDTITTVLVDYRGYGYIGISADLVNINGEPGSDASKALRKGFMTLLAVYRDTVINSYYGDRAAVIQYPISNTSWAAPKPADEGYRTAYSVDVDGNPIYDASMSEEERYAAAKEAAIGYFKAAGFTFDEATGKFTDVPETGWEIMIPGQGTQDHPAYGIAVAASEVCKDLGITLQVNDVGTSTWSAALNGNTAMMWAAAWQASVDPDMTQVYHSSNAHGAGTNSNHYAVDDENLDELIVEGRSSADTEYRKSIYKQAMELIMDWGVELPLYQRKDCTVFSTARVNIDTIPGDMTPFWGWAAEIEKMEAR